MFKGNMNFRKKEDRKVIISHFRDALFRNWSDEWISKNSLHTCLNLFYNQKWALINRPTAKELWSGLPVDSNRVTGIWHSKELWEYICEKNWIIYKTTWWAWSSIWTWSWPSSEDYTDILDFYTLWTTVKKTWTSTVVDERFIETGTVLTENNHVWQYLTINSQTRLITSNTTSKIFIDWTFEITPTVGATFNVYEKASAMFCITDWPDMRVRDWTTLSSITSAKRWTVEHNRLFIVDWSNANRLRFSILWVWDEFPQNNYVDFDFDIICIKNVRGRIIVYWNYDRAELLWDSPDNFSILKNATHKWALSGWSVSNGTNIQFFLSNEWIENLNAIDNASTGEWISISDNIKDLLFLWNDFEDYKIRAHWSVSGWKYFLNIWWTVIIYDIEKSLLFQTPVFSTAEYSEASQLTDTWYDQPWEWTCSRDISWKLYFWQWGKIYSVNHDETSNLFNYTAIMEIDRLDLWDNWRNKKIRRVKQFFKSCERATEFKTYVSINDWTYELVNTATYWFNSTEYQAWENFQYEIFLSKLWEDIKVKTEITQTWAWNVDFNMNYQHLRTEVYIVPLSTY